MKCDADFCKNLQVNLVFPGGNTIRECGVYLLAESSVTFLHSVKPSLFPPRNTKMIKVSRLKESHV